MKALIIGGGVAGPAAAMALQKAGIDSVIYEAHPAGAYGVGATMGLSTNGLAALQVLDAHRAVADAGFPCPRGVMWLGDGRRLGEDVPAPLPDGTTAVQLRRADLYAALHGHAAARGVPVEYGRRLVQVEHRGDRIVARFADGGEAVGDVLIGADGMRSATRRFVAPDGPRPRYCGIFGTNGFAHGLDLDSGYGTFHMVFGRRAFFGYVQREDGCVWWFVNVPAAREPMPAQLAAIPAEQWRQRLHGLLAVDVSPAARIVQATPPGYDWFAAHQMKAPKTWHRGRAVLIGDAAHVTSPSSGQGAAMAVEDAVELARCLRDLPVAQALPAYQRLREGRLRKVHAGARQVNRSKSATGPSRVLRDAMFPVLMKRFGGPQALSWLYDHRIDFDSKVEADAG
ncbi:FAD-dependent oxidoreductase [Planomonospora parontospora subsp. parontospora]|uniref:FAD-dependent oxidoreductase n=2 Tax=Planomonospora parontospora TaxID=58119 RepID=A0AA37BCP8_9ACTN|nr:NAD(P)/FAD-dependent oxidoreductase [Planomonospora parontospora]GGK52199.1 FAD-dependent oxidoreductase [Planomonospora parontospora]GII06900.1 FAD-dependent oxidoreductase [Planomonospora parontospora subsp. parontospora]